MALLPVALFPACVSTAPPTVPHGSRAFQERCVPPPRAIEADADPALPVSSQITEASPAMTMADALGVRPLVDRLATLRAEGRTQTIDYLAVRQELADRVLLAVFELEATVAEITCERDRTDQLADLLDARDTSRVKQLTLASIVIGGIGSIVSGAIGLAAASSVTADAAEVSAGALATAFGGTALFVTNKESFRHERNLLREIWDDPPNSRLYPAFVWRFLHRKVPSKPMTLREEIIAAWQQQGRLGDPGTKTEHKHETLFFGDGGAYTAADLRARASMLETLEASVRLINEQLEQFVRDVMRGRAGAVAPT